MNLTAKTVTTDPIYLSLSSIRARTDMSERTIRRMHKEGQVRLYRIRGKLFAKFEELVEDLEQIAEPLVPTPLSHSSQAA